MNYLYIHVDPSFFPFFFDLFIRIKDRTNLLSVLSLLSWFHLVFHLVFVLSFWTFFSLTCHTHTHTQKKVGSNWLWGCKWLSQPWCVLMLIVHVTNSICTGPSHPTMGLVLWMKWPNSQMAVLILLEATGQCLLVTLLLHPLSSIKALSSQRMDNGLSLCHNQADARTQSQWLVKSHQNKTHKQANTPSEQPRWHSCSHYSQREVFRWGWWAKNGKRNYCIASGWGLGVGVCVSGSPLPTTNSAKPSICAMTVWLLCSHFRCNLHAIWCLPHWWAISNCDI